MGRCRSAERHQRNNRSHRRRTRRRVVSATAATRPRSCQYVLRDSPKQMTRSPTRAVAGGAWARRSIALLKPAEPSQKGLAGTFSYSRPIALLDPPNGRGMRTMRAGVYGHPANRGFVAVRVRGDYHHPIVSQNLPSLKRPCCTVDLLDGHAGSNTVAEFLCRRQTCLGSLQSCHTDEINHTGQNGHLYRSDENG